MDVVVEPDLARVERREIFGGFLALAGCARTQSVCCREIESALDDRSHRTSDFTRGQLFLHVPRPPTHVVARTQYSQSTRRARVVEKIPETKQSQASDSTPVRPLLPRVDGSSQSRWEGPNKMNKRVSDRRKRVL